MLKRVSDLTSTDFSKGLNTVSNILSLEKNQSPNIMDVRVNFDGSIEKRLGTSTQNSAIISASANAAFIVSSNNTLTTNLKAYWKLDESDGIRLDSYSSHTLQDGNTVGQTVGKKRFAANFISANSEFLLINNTATLATGDVDFSMAGWFKLTTTSSTVQQTVIAKRKTTPTAGNDANALLLLHFDGEDASTIFTDSSPSGRSPISAASGTEIDTGQLKFGSASGIFPGSDGGLSVPDSTDWAFGTNDFTIDFWVRFNTLSANVGLIGQMQTADEFWSFRYETTNTLRFRHRTGASNVIDASWSWTPSTGTWYHVALVRSGTSFIAFVDGASLGTVVDNSAIVDLVSPLYIGLAYDDAGAAFIGLTGWLDEFRISNVARWTANFTAPTEAYSTNTTTAEFEYWLYVNTDNLLTLDVSSSGLVFNGRVQASSFGALSTGNWYNFVAYHDSVNDKLGVSVNLSLTTASYASGVRSGSSPFVIGAVSSGTTAPFNGAIDEVGFWKKVLTAQERSDLYNGAVGNTYNLAFSNEPWASFDFGASDFRWLVVAAGTGIYASSDLGANFTTIATDRSATYQWLDRSKNVMTATSDAYNTPLIWTGSPGTYMTILNPSAPLCKYSINHQGYLILLNKQGRKRAFYYEDENSQITGAWSNVFDIPSSYDDEITVGFTLRKNLYVSTKYKLFRITYIGGNPDWSYKEIKDWGYVPRTVKKINVKDAGEVIIGLDWSKKIRLFDGTDDRIISDPIENDNRLCDFALDKVSYANSGLMVSFAEVDPNEQVYKLCLAVGENSSQTTHMLNFDGRGMAFYPYSNTPFNTMVMSESANRRYLLVFDRSGYCHIADSGNLDANRTPINEVYDSPLFFEKSPSEVAKSQRIDLFFSAASCGTMHYLDRTDFSPTFTERRAFILTNNKGQILIKQTVDIPQTQGVYQYRLTSSAGTATPWKLNRADYFLKNLGIGRSDYEDR